MNFLDNENRIKYWALTDFIWKNGTKISHNTFQFTLWNRISDRYVITKS